MVEQFLVLDWDSGPWTEYNFDAIGEHISTNVRWARLVSGWVGSNSPPSPKWAWDNS